MKGRRAHNKHTSLVWGLLGPYRSRKSRPSMAYSDSRGLAGWGSG